MIGVAELNFNIFPLNPHETFNWFYMVNKLIKYIFIFKFTFQARNAIEKNLYKCNFNLMPTRGERF